MVVLMTDDGEADGEYGKFNFRHDAGALQCLVVERVEQHDRAFPDGPEFPQQFFQGALVGNGVFGKNVFVKTWQLCFVVAAKPQCPVSKHTLRIDEMLYKIADGPFPGCIYLIAEHMPGIPVERIDVGKTLPKSFRKVEV